MVIPWQQTWTEDERKVDLCAQNNLEAKRHRTEWCAAGSNYRCMRCGRSSKKMNMPGACEDPRWLGTDFNCKLIKRYENTHLGGQSKWRGFVMAQEVFGSCAVPFGTEADEPLQAREESHGIRWEHVQKIILKLQEGRVPDWKRRRMERRRDKKKSHKERRG